MDELTDQEVNKLLERFDQTKPALQRKIIASFVQRLARAEDALKAEREQTASKIRDISRRIGVACTRDWIREKLDELASQLERWAK
jgi:hypothetical protein